ncbi:MAG: hypothetical protein RLZZ450_6091 [Pseudomonadota bacterium]|jgi:uncharacterized protein YlxP (DUF503 family)
MVVGICRIVLSLPWNDSLKGKRSVVKSILERARGRFHVSASEVEDHDVHRRATLGFALVSNDARHVGSVLDKLVSFVASATQAQVIDQSRSIEHYDLAITGRGGDSWNPSDWNDEDGDDEEED